VSEPDAPIRAGFVSLGCAKNLVDTQVMAGLLREHGMDLAPLPEEADVVIVNTCAFIEDARQESIENILALCELKRAGRCRAILVAGCLSQRYREDLRGALPDVDGFVGLDELDRVPDLVRRLAAGETGLCEVSGRARRLYEPPAKGIVLSSGAYAYLKIAEGCNHPCAFCAIPAIRGRHRSRAPAKIVAEARARVDMGFRELDVISQDTTAYGRDRRDGASLPALLRELGAALPAPVWIRLLYGFPTGITDALLEAMVTTEGVCAYLDVPVQHSHPDILRAMRRGHTARAVRRLPHRVRERLPGAALRTTCLVGFPGETEAHFRHLLDYVREARFEHLGVFVYSPEEGTAAFGMRGRPRLRTAERRRQRLLEAQREIVDSRARDRLNTQTTVLLERPHPRRRACWIGRSQAQAPRVDGETRVANVPADAAAGQFARVCITGQDGYDIEARFLAHAG
jgi:ribosomal protein S12 methylthiotransferase